MKRLTSAPNLALATLWRDMLAGAGIDCSVQRAYSSGIAGEIPPDQALPEIWVLDDGALESARSLFPKTVQIAKDNAEKLYAASQELVGISVKTTEAIGDVVRGQYETVAAKTAAATASKKSR